MGGGSSRPPPPPPPPPPPKVDYAAIERQRQEAERQRQAQIQWQQEQERQRQAAIAAEQERQRQAAIAAEQERQRQAAIAAEQERQRQAAIAAEQERQRQAAIAEQQRQAAIAAAKTAATEAIAAADAALAAVREAETAGADVTSTKTAAENAKASADKAKNDANAAQTTNAANVAKTLADNAKNAANAARTAALAAKTAAETARVSAIGAAKTAATEAIAAADAALAAVKEAETAGADVTSTKTAAENAKASADKAKNDANAAQTTDVANAAKTLADNAKAAANAARTAALAAKAAAEAKSLADTKTSAIAIATEAATTADSAVVVAEEAIKLGGPSAAAAEAAKTKATEAKNAATDAKTSAEGATTATAASAAKTAAEAAKTKATEAKKAADDAKAGNVAAAEAKCKTPVLMTFTAKVEPNAAVPATGPVAPNVYWTNEGSPTVPNKEFILIPGKDKTGNIVTDALTYCGKEGKFLILYNNADKERNIQYEIIAAVEKIEKPNTDTYFKFNIKNVGGTTGFTKSNIRDGQDIFIRTSEAKITSQAPSAASSTFKNACTDPNSKTFANCKPVCIPTDASGNILYKEGTSMPTRIVQSKNQWLANYYEYRPVKGIGSDGSVQYLPMDPSKTFVGGGTDCTEPCPPQDTGKTRPKFCRPPDPNWGKKPDKEKGEIGLCPIGCMKVDDPTSRRNSSACKYDKMKGYTCGAVCDFNASSECKKNTDCANCGGSEYITQFPVGWKPTLTRRIEEVYSRDDCNNKCKKATVDTCRNFLQLQQSGMYLENRCRKIGTSGKKVICGPISNKTQTGLVSGYDLCITCKSNKDLYAYFEFDKKWNPTTKQWDFINIREITTPSANWFEGDVNSFSEGGVSSSGGGRSGASGGSRGGDAGSGWRDEGGSGANLRGSKPSGYQEDRDTRDARDSRDMGKIQSGTNSKSITISSASQNAKRQEMSAKVTAMKLQLDKMTNEYRSLEDNVKWNKMQMDKAEKDCYDINGKLQSAIRVYTRAEEISMRSGATIKDKKETEAANTQMYAIKQKAREICDNYGSLKEKYMKSVNELNTLKAKISDLNEKYKTASASIGGGSGGDGGSFLSPIINIFFGDDANRDCSGQLGCGNGIDYSFPSPFNSSVSGKFTPQPFYGGIRL